MSISIEFPDGSKKPFDDGVNVLDVAKSISTSLGKKAIAGKFNGELVDLDRPLKQDGKLAILTNQDADALVVLNDTAAFILAAVLKQTYPKMHFGEGHSTADGFFYDTDNADGQVTVNDLSTLKEKMMQLIKANGEIKRVLVSKDTLLKEFAGDPYKESLINAQAGVEVPAFQLGDFIDFGYRALLKKAGEAKVFDLLSVAGAYWQGKSSNPMLQRIYGTAFYKQADLDADLKRRSEIKERDHRTLGRELDLFFVDPKVGAGLPYWMPNGATIRRTIERYIIDREVAAGYEHVYTPVLANLDLYKQSGHWDHYRDDMFPPMDMGDGEMLELRPMNCPSHIQIYQHHLRSYRELPIRIAELGMMHRYEKSGALSGLQRVREMTLNDGHTFVRPDQIQDEFKNILKLMMSVYDDFDITDYTFRLSYRDPQNTEKYFDDDEMWNKSQAMLKGAMDDLGLDYYEAEGEAAFYGPKLDVQTKTALGNDETLSTIQLDFMMPEKFHLVYTGEDGEEHRPVMIHRGVISTMERFIAYLTEIYKGAFPTWLAPTQVDIIPVNLDLHVKYAETIQKQLLAEGIRVKIDKRNEKMGYKIREAQTQKIPYTLVVGDQEVEDATVSVRPYSADKPEKEDLNVFLDSVVAEVHNYSRTGKKNKAEAKLDK
ncbi:threonyl-tRNA synthetase [Agrilactobacillus composti DSM 18527 = JCM 14202]|uniref:Threonine--tRNA ligase n=1 Tax=Agrilactobacillus composti DSM 18527 = JCM 14202 TaxID=1423734 RepID=X0PE91_9LACO|nr:threonine--tRNA ligase [Agrilactobacillus composti]KRM35780.1 threonyl-tRNA synthetase [Agrilactobacillus composti DSM 18527 = JCM 14202]GAF39643.1 threonyl-tRNA synthetase [Agrilactobacillus composti DSM 18527 = JCM 14202]